MARKHSNAQYLLDMEDWWGEIQPGTAAPGAQKRPRHRLQDLPPRERREDAQEERRAVKARDKRRQKQLSRLLMYATVALLFVFLFMQVNRFATIASQSKEISSLVSEINRLENEKTNQKSRLAAREDLKRVSDEATYNLDMAAPAEEQKRYLTIPNANGDVSENAANSADLAQ